MIGRDTELRRLREAADLVDGGESASVLVLGEPGIGKTRLVTEIRSQLRDAGWAVGTGHGIELSGGELPFGVLAETLRDLIRELGLDEVRAALNGQAAALAPLVPALGDRVQARPGREPGRTDRARVVSATADLFRPSRSGDRCAG